MHFDTDNPHRSTPSVTMTTGLVLACTTQALPSPHEGPAIGSLHVMQPTPRFRLSIEAETIDLAPCSCENPAAAHCSCLGSLHMIIHTPRLRLGIEAETAAAPPRGKASSRTLSGFKQ